MAEGTNDSGNGSRDKSSPTKLRFPQGSEVWITGCPKFGTAEISGLTNPELEAETAQPGHRRWRAVSALSSELVAGVVVGAVIGWGFDRLLSTSPWGLIVFLLLGFTAGVINVMRSAGVAAGAVDRLTDRSAGTIRLQSAGAAGRPRDAHG